MLRNNDYLDFPALKYEREQVLIRKPSKFSSAEGNVNLYRLDWEAFDARRKEKFERRYPGCQKLPWEDPLPKEYMDKLDSQLFALNNRYLNEIRRCSREAVSEHSIPRSFDTGIREYCLKASQAHIDIAFYLLTDCAFDEETSYYLKDRRWLHKAMLYRFWAKQTGSYVAMVLAGISEWTDREVIRGNREASKYALKPENPKLQAFYEAIYATQQVQQESAIDRALNIKETAK